MNLFFLNDDVILNCLFPYLDLKDRYNLSNTCKLCTEFGKIYKLKFKIKDDDTYIYIVTKVKENIEKELHMFIDLLFNDSVSLNDRIRIYGENLEDGIYYYSKNVYYREYNSPLYFFPVINFRSHNLYMILFVKNNKHKTKIFKNY